MARQKKITKGSGGSNVVAPVVSALSTKTSNSVVVALNFPTKLRFDLAGGRKVVLNGNAEYLRGKEQGQIPAGAYGLTTVLKDDWDEILKKYGSMKVFKNHLCFASNSENDAKEETKDLTELRHGREPAPAKMEQTEAAQEAI